MPKTQNTEALKDHFTAVHRLLAVFAHLELVKKFTKDHALQPSHADMLDMAVENVELTLKKAEQIG